MVVQQQLAVQPLFYVGCPGSINRSRVNLTSVLYRDQVMGELSSCTAISARVLVLELTLQHS